MIYIGKYKIIADQLRREGVDESQIEKNVREEMERDIFEIENGTTNLEAYRIWKSWPEERRESHLNGVYCGNCGGVTSFASGYNVKKSKWGLILQGNCAKCGGRIRKSCN